MKKIATKRCPFCGGGGLIAKSEGVNLWRVFCYECGAKGALGGSEEDAIEKWDKRYKGDTE